MSKRRNPKKEKAQRNKAYARKFRKRQTTGRFSKNRNWKTGKSSETAAEGQDDELETGGQDQY
ncbi:MAG TPA: hypothetical protein VIQ31_17145 [Phormidium sp.]